MSDTTNCLAGPPKLMMAQRLPFMTDPGQGSLDHAGDDAAPDRTAEAGSGEIRDWEFGSPPCGWVFAIDVDPRARLAGVGSKLLQAISDHFRRAGVGKLRTLLALDNTLILSFFRSQGMMAGPLISLEMEIDS